LEAEEEFEWTELRWLIKTMWLSNPTPQWQQTHGNMLMSEACSFRLLSFSEIFESNDLFLLIDERFHVTLQKRLLMSASLEDKEDLSPDWSWFPEKGSEELTCEELHVVEIWIESLKSKNTEPREVSIEPEETSELGETSLESGELIVESNEMSTKLGKTALELRGTFVKPGKTSFESKETFVKSEETPLELSGASVKSGETSTELRGTFVKPGKISFE
jgi:hypothetical protein